VNPANPQGVKKNVSRQDKVKSSSKAKRAKKTELSEKEAREMVEEAKASGLNARGPSPSKLTSWETSPYSRRPY